MNFRVYYQFWIVSTYRVQSCSQMSTIPLSSFHLASHSPMVWMYIRRNQFEYHVQTVSNFGYIQMHSKFMNSSWLTFCFFKSKVLLFMFPFICCLLLSMLAFFFFFFDNLSMLAFPFVFFFSWLNMLNKCWCYFSKLSVYEGVESFYKEEDEIVPVNMYGKSKVAAEQFISANWPSFAILRSSIIYGPQTVSPVTKSLPIQVQMIVPFFINVFMLDICPAWVKVLRWL